MGRPRLHATAEERAAAARKYRQDYYERNKKTISMKMAAKYKARKPVRKKREEALVELSVHPERPESHHTEQEQETPLPDSPACIDFRQRIQDIQAAVSQAMAPHAEDFFEHVYSSLTKNSSDYTLRLSIISDTLKLLEGHSLRARSLEAELLQEAQGNGKLLSQAQALTQRLRDMTKSAEELWCFTVEDAGIAKLIQQHSAGKLQFQRLVVHK
ncbi:hypothetical protein K503DRAFT_870008 [Rhizopogon vinicolor AM-OR11-026]|uniref:Uncharacterized protein n=1 Tax=Rhizopogon vinicolor AM-OR11-026 TaxID=1314800 RepID=A0A1B7MJD0_9AGAM|nr:hypothetical protein K503DRAFT_870008 [Rhizopogon vinicolor AM-OR11-026]